VTDHHLSPAVRRAVKALALAPAVLLSTAAGPALAAAPEQWPTQPHVSALHALLIYLVAPGGVALLITLLVYVPSLARGQKYQPGLAWRNEPEWFGGPREGVEAADKAAAAAGATEGGHDERGGASARW
jgi:hypothetical protein